MDKISEVEFKALISPQVAPGFFEKIGSLSKLSADFFVERFVDFKIDDTYFDTRDLLLWQKRGYLRLRNFRNNNDRVLTYRKETPGTYGERIEVASRVSSEIEWVLKELYIDIPGLSLKEKRGREEKEIISSLGFLELASFSIERRILRVKRKGDEKVLNVKLDKVYFPSVRSSFVQTSKSGPIRESKDLAKEIFYELEINCFSFESLGDTFSLYEILNGLSGGNLVLSSEFKIETCLLFKRLSEIASARNF